MRDNLIPRQITDKNGHLTTKWVKPDTSEAGAKTKIPVPVLAPEPPAVNHRADVLELLREPILKYADNPRKFINEASESIIAYVHENLMAENKPEYFAEEVSTLLSDNTEEHVVEAWLHLYEFHDGKLDDMEAVNFIRGALDSGSNIQRGQYDRNDPKRAESIKNLFTFIHEADHSTFMNDVAVPGVTSMTDFNAYSTRIDGNHIADYIINHGEQTEKVISVANDHPKELDLIIKAASKHPDRFDEIKDLFVNHYERVEGRDMVEVTAILDESKNWTPVSDGIL